MKDRELKSFLDELLGIVARLEEEPAKAVEAAKRFADEQRAKHGEGDYTNRSAFEVGWLDNAVKRSCAELRRALDARRTKTDGRDRAAAKRAAVAKLKAPLVLVLVAMLGHTGCATDDAPSGPPLCAAIAARDATKADFTCNAGGLCSYRGEACCVDPRDLRDSTKDAVAIDPQCEGAIGGD